jgi:hypothetical protein
VVFIDAINVKIREGQVANRPVYLALGVTVDGERDVLGLWAGEHGDGEGAKYWLRVLSEIKNRGVRDVCMLVCDGLKGLPDAVSAVWDKTIVQTCIVHLLRNSFKYASKRDWAAVAKDLKPVYTAASESEALDRFAEFSGNGRNAIRLLYGCGRTRGRSSCHSFASTGKYELLSARPTRSNLLMPGSGEPSTPAATSRPSRLPSSACTWRS